MKQQNKYLISGGGTGGHIFPAIAIAEAIKTLDQTAQFLFVGAKGKMEMKKVPDAGYPIVGLWISGFNRSLTLKNLLFPIKLVHSLMLARKIIRNYKPNVVIGTGGYASGPTLRVASKKGIPCLIQEQNSFPGITNRILAKKVNTICVAYNNMNRYFPAEKIQITGNPVRLSLQVKKENITEARRHFNIRENNTTILIVGGSQGAKAINNTILSIVGEILAQNTSIIWQTGEFSFDEAKKLEVKYGADVLSVHKFINRMDYAYGAADVVISRAGAIAISELCIAAKATIFIPLPSAAEDHQTKNAAALAEQQAAVFVPEVNITEQLLPAINSLIHDETKRKKLAQNINTFAMPNAATNIAQKAISLLQK